MKRLKDESGQALIITALCMTCLFGFAALATDVGLMLREKRLLQIAADSAAVAGALETNYSSTSVTSAAQAAATQNGFTNGTNGATVTVHTPPQYGPNASATNTNYVEVIISQSQPTLFMNFFGIASMNPTVRAVAKNGGASLGCIYVLSPNAPQAMYLQGSFTVTAPNCGIIVDSSDPDALHFQGSAGTLQAGSVGVVGDCGGKCTDSTPAPVTGIVPQSDPLVGVIPSPPNPASLSCSAPTSSSSSAGSAGTLSGNVVMSNTAKIMCYSGNVNVTGVTNFPAGTYVFTGNVTLGGTVTTAAPTVYPVTKAITNPLNGVTLDVDSGTFTVNTGTTLSLSAPKAAATVATDGYTNYNGIAIMEPSRNSNTITIQMGNSTGKIDGIIYAPSAELLLHDSGGDTGGGIALITDLIVGTLVDQTATLSLQSYTQSTPGSPLTKVMLVE